MRRFAVALMAVLLALTACGGPAKGISTADPSAPSAQSLLAFTGTTLDGQPFDGTSLAGKPAVLWFWAPWCPTCLQQAPGVRAAVDKYAGRVAIVGIAGLDKTAAMPEFVRLAKVSGLPHLADEPGVLWKRFGVTAQSTFVLLDAAGEVVFRGPLTAGEIPDRIGELLA
jgi:thiol-disulfide isomerase/thioredoxin